MKKKKTKTDAQIIDELGGHIKLAERLGYKRRGGAERVNNWRTRGIPARVKLEHLALFGLQK